MYELIRINFIFMRIKNNHFLNACIKTRLIARTLWYLLILENVYRAVEGLVIVKCLFQRYAMPIIKYREYFGK